MGDAALEGDPCLMEDTEGGAVCWTEDIHVEGGGGCGKEDAGGGGGGG